MLPGFRFLFGAIVLSMSLLTFGLGAAALLRAAHEEFASIPSRRAPPEPVFAAQNDHAPTLALASIEPAADQDIPASPTSDAPESAAVAIDQPPPAVVPEPENPVTGPAPSDVASITEQASPAEAPIRQTSDAEVRIETEAPAQNEGSSAATETEIAAITPTEPDQGAAAAPDQVTAPAADSTSIAETRIATLGGPPVTIEARKPAKPARPVARKITRATRVVKRPKIAQRQRPARPAPRQPAPQQPANPFGTPFGR